jgi:DNA-binding FrmR family transcriptional regulator
MNKDEAKVIDRRLARIEGQVRGIRRLNEQDAYCCDVLNQILAVNSALKQVAAAIATEHIKHCIAGHEEGDGHDVAKAMTKEELIDELDEVMSRLMK